MRNRWWSWGLSIFAAIVVASVAVPQTADAAQVGSGSAMNGMAGGNSKTMRRMMMMKKMRKRRAMMQGQPGTRTGTGAAAGAGS
jgi:hypothetical protein